MSAIFAQEMVGAVCHLTIGTASASYPFGVLAGSGWVLFTAMVFGHFGLTIPRG